MKIVLALLLFAGVALGYSTSYFGWAPQKEYIYHYESQMLTGIPEIRSQYSGLKLSSKVKIQSFPDYSLRIQFIDPRFVTVNEILPSIDGKIYIPTVTHEEIPEAVRHPLVTPFEVHFKRGVVEGLFVEKNEPVVVTNVKKALLTQLQTDLSGSREGYVQKLNHFVLPQVVTAQEEMRNVSYFRTMERSIYGDCETSYTIHPMPLYQARELEEQWRVHKFKVSKTIPMYTSKVMTEEEISRQSFEAERVCEGKQYYQIVKTHNFDNCRERPVFATFSGMKSNCDASKSGCEDAFSAVSSSRYIVCGMPEQFIIRKVTTENVVVLQPASGINTEEQLKTFATVTLELRTVETSGFQPIHKPVAPKKIPTLYLEYPESQTFSPNSISHRMFKKERIAEGSATLGRDYHGLKSLTGFYPLHPMPEMETSPELLFPISIPKPELYRQVREMIGKIVRETYEVPESCSSSSDLAGYIVSVAKSLRPLSLNELKEMQAEILRFMEIKDKEAIKTAQYLFYDILTMVGTNPSIIFLKETIESEEIPRLYAPKILQSALKNVKTPTQQLFNAIFSLVKTLKGKSPQLYSASCVTFSDLLHRACINPSSMVTEFPVHIYGNFCNPETSFITEQYIPYLETQLESSVRSSSQEKVILINSLGKLGHYRAIPALAKIIEGQISTKPMIRSLAVYALKRAGIQYPSKIRPILLNIIDNPAEHPEVRIAAVAVLPFSSPSAAELHKIGLRTWFEPSKQVASFIYSTFKSLEFTEVPELVKYRNKIKFIIPMIRRSHSGIQFSHNIHISKFIEYLKIVTSNKLELVNSPESLIPTKISFSQDFINRSLRVKGLSFSLYTQGMDYVLEKLMTKFNLKEEASQNVRSELQKIDEKLQIKKREILEPEAHLRFKLMGIERIFSFDSEFYFETIQKITEKLRSDPEVFSHGLPYKYTKARNLFDVQSVGPTATGFPINVEMTVPFIYSVKGYFYGQSPKTPEGTAETYPTSMMRIKVSPVLNIKLETTMGVISPFTKQYIGSGFEMGIHSSTPFDAKVRYNYQGQLDVSVKSPEEIQHEVELAHVIYKPFTFKKSFEAIVPPSQSAGNKLITSGNVIKKFEINPTARTLGIDAPFKLATDYPVFDLANMYTKIRKNSCPIFALQTIGFPQSLRYLSLNLKFNPTSSATKEFQTRFTYAAGYKNSPSEFIHYRIPKAYTHEKELLKMCNENHQRESEIRQCMETQKKSLESLADVSSEGKKLCGQHVHVDTFPERFRTYFDLEMNNCLKAAKICESAENVCTQKSSSSKTCSDKKMACIARQINLVKLNTVLHNLEMGSGLSVSLEATLNTHYERKTFGTLLSAGFSRRNQEVRGYIRGNYIVPGEEPSVFVGETLSRIPSIRSRWSLEEIIDNDIQFENNVVMYHGKISTPHRELRKYIAKLTAEKTEAQKKSIKESPEYVMCKKEIAEGRVLAPVCEKLRHQASSADKLIIRVKYPKEIKKNTPGFSYMRNVAEALFFPYFEERYFEGTSAVEDLKRDERILEAYISHEGDYAKIKYRQHGVEWDIHRLRLPKIYAHNLIPFSFRNIHFGAFSRFTQKLTAQQTPASCAIEPNFITTFDNKTYPYTLNDCEHLLVKDCSGIWPMGVTARGNGGQKELKVMAGLSVIQIKPIQGSVLNGIKINGEKIEMREGQVYRHYYPQSSGTKMNEPTNKGKASLEIWSYVDGTIVIRELESSMHVIFDGERIEIVPPQTLTSRACGLCGDMNGESTADLRTPKMCVFEKPRIAAYTYMIKENCMGIPTQTDKMEYEKEIRQCVKKSTIFTPLQDLTTRTVKVKSGPAGIVSKHLVEYRANGNEVCFSQTVINICEGRSVPVIGHMSSTPFTCLPAYTQVAKHIKQRVTANEEIPELRKFPVTYNRMIEEASNCKASSSDINNTGTDSSRHYQPETGRFQPQIYDY